MTKPQRPARPDKLRIGGALYDVTYDLDSHVAAERSMGGENGVGVYAGVSHRTRQRITISPRDDVHPDSQRDTLLHEVLHQCLRASGCDPDLDAKANLEDVEERAVTAMAPVLLAALRDNPALVPWLLDRGRTGDAR